MLIFRTRPLSKWYQILTKLMILQTQSSSLEFYMLHWEANVLTSVCLMSFYFVSFWDSGIYNENFKFLIPIGYK